MALKLNGTNSVAAPAYAGADADTGLQCGSDELKLVTGGTARATVNSSGNVLVGTTSDSIYNDTSGGGFNIKNDGQLVLAKEATSSADPLVWLNDTGQTTNKSIVFAQDGSEKANIGLAGNDATVTVNGSERMRISSTGLHTITASNNSTAVQIRDASNYAGQLVTATDGTFQINARTATTFTRTGSNTESMRIDSSGRLLLQTTDSTGSQLLKVNGDTSNTTNGGRIALTQGRTTPGNGATHGVLSFGTETRPAQVELIGFVDGTWTDGQYHPSGLLINCTAYNRSDATERVRITDTGEFNAYGDGSVFQAGTLQGAGTNVYFYEGRRNQNSGGTRTYIVYSNGNVQNTNNSYGSLSDQRLKENIVDATSQWDDIKSLQIRKYNFREATGHETHTQIGLIAQEAENVSPGLVQTTAVAEGETVQDPDGNQLESLKSINYSVLYMKAVKALQEAQTRIETLETQNTAQQTQIDDLLVRVTALEAAS